MQRETVEPGAYPDLVVSYLGMRVNAWHGLKTLPGFGPRIATVTVRLASKTQPSKSDSHPPAS